MFDPGTAGVAILAPEVPRPNLRVTYVDSEITGLSAHDDCIIEIAVLLAEVD